VNPAHHISKSRDNYRRKIDRFERLRDQRHGQKIALRRAGCGLGSAMRREEHAKKLRDIF
jgi:hypothetical protein